MPGSAKFHATGLTNDHWSNPAAWVRRKLPHQGVDIRLGTGGTADLGTAQKPFTTDDIIGASAGSTLPSLTVTGFIHAEDIKNLATLNVGTPFGSDWQTAPGGTLRAERLVNVKDVAISALPSGPSTLEIEHGVGAATFNMASFGSYQSATLILDHPTPCHFANAIRFSAVGGRIELGDMQFSAARFVPDHPVPSPNGAFNGGGKVILSEHGQTVYQLDHVSGFPAQPVSVGVDAKTGHDFVAFGQ
jgi:hypothetical protein